MDSFLSMSVHYQYEVIDVTVSTATLQIIFTKSLIWG